MKKNTRHRTKKRSPFIAWMIAFAIAISCLLLLKVLAIDVYIVHSSSMEATLKPGDILLVNKYGYGARIPLTPLALPFLSDRYRSSSPDYFIHNVHLPYYRIRGKKNIEHNSILVFNYPMDQDHPIDKRILYAKRCVGLPGDTVEMKKGELYVNHRKIIIPQVQYAYRVLIKGRSIPKDLIERINITEGNQINELGTYLLYLTSAQAEILKKEPQVISVKREKQPTDKAQVLSEDMWTNNDFGPVIVPAASMRINKPGKKGFDLMYCNVAKQYENTELNSQTFYFFKQNYFFMMDDNRDNSKDSRQWGFLPENHILGKATRILYSLDPNAVSFEKIRFNRVLIKIK